jgi:sensor histidine kinase YesM
MPFIVLLIGWVLVGNYYFTNFTVFLSASAVTLVILTILWISITWLAVTIRNRFSRDKDLVKRIAIFIPLIVLLSWLALTIIFNLLNQWVTDGYSLNEKRYYWALLVSAVINIFITLLHEGISGFEKWKSTLIETEELKKVYMQSQLLGLKSQVNPHFLFNSLNSLSCLIQENKEQAETFIDEMSKVYRYLLRSNEEQLVTLETELQFAHSYFHMLKARHGDGIILETNISEEDRHRYLPPLTLQILLETAFQVNMISRDHPLKLKIKSLDNGWLEISNNIQKKFSDENSALTGLENIVSKYRLLCQQCVSVAEGPSGRTVQIPLMDNPENNCVV